MNIQLLHNNSENNAIRKKISFIENIEAHIKNNMNVESPIILLKYSGNTDNINYLYIPEYNRYYFINDIKLVTGGAYEIYCNVDVLESFKNSILNLSCVIDKQQNLSKSNKYINDGSFVVQSNEANYIQNFPSGFNETGTYILICAGG